MKKEISYDSYDSIHCYVKCDWMRKQKGYTQTQLAKIVGTTQTTINAIENGHWKPSLKLLVALSIALECNLDDLVYVQVDRWQQTHEKKKKEVDEEKKTGLRK